MRIRTMGRMGLATLSARMGLGAPPVNAMISVTDRCQARCTYCGIPERQQRELTTGEMLGLLDELRDAGVQRVAFWGGEPLLRADIGRLVDHAKLECGFHVSLDTNGYLVPERLDAVRHLDVLAISYDGPPGGHERNREPGSHAKVYEALRLASRRLRVFSITVLTRANVGQVDAILDTARALGFAATFQLLHLTPGLGSEAERELLPSDAATRSALRLLIERKRQGAPIASSLAYLEHLLAWPDYQACQAPDRRGPPCFAGTLFFNVDTDGSVYPCSRMIGRMPARKVTEGGFREAFAAMGETGCRSCTASSLVEYNLVHSLHLGAIWNWVRQTAG